MSQASQDITQQFINGGVIPGQLNGQSTVNKKYVDDQDAIRDGKISVVASVASNAQSEVDSLEVRVSNIITNAGDSNLEIVDARGTYPVLSARLGASDAQLADIAYNVKAFGAKGDGVTDDTLSIKAAITAVNLTGGTLYFPQGTYIYSNFFSPGSNTTWRGVRGASVLKMKPTDLPTYGVVNVGNISNFNVSGLTFIGNSIDPVTLPGTAESAFFMLNCNDILFENCYFSGYRGLGIAFQGGKNTKVINCKFENHGQNLIPFRGTRPKAVPAIWSAFNNDGLVVDNCDFIDCRWSGVFMIGTNGMVKNCRMTHMGETGIYSEYGGADSPTINNQAIGNTITDVYMVDVTACGIEWTTSNSLIANNIVSLCEADGIAIGPCSYTTVSDNTCFNNNVKNILGGRGIGVTNKGSVAVPTAGRGIKITGNTCYDDRVPELQLHGIQINTLYGGSNYLNCMVSNNILYRHVVSDLDIEPGKFDDPSNIISNNNGWLDVQKNTSTADSTSSTSQTPLKIIAIPPNSLGKVGGIKITAWGIVTGAAGAKYVTLKFDTGITEFSSIVFLMGQTGSWRFEAYVQNQNATNIQNLSAITYKDAAVYGQVNTSSSVDTTLPKNVAILGQLDSSADSVICNGLIVERI